jgi:hypothetical protein
VVKLKEQAISDLEAKAPQEEVPALNTALWWVYTLFSPDCSSQPLPNFLFCSVLQLHWLHLAQPSPFSHGLLHQPCCPDLGSLLLHEKAG